MNVLLTRVLTLALTLLLSAWSFITSADTKQSADASAREQRTVHLASLDWPPYAGSSLPGGGASVTVLRAALAEMGYELEVDFYPWARVITIAADESNKYAGYFPEYFNQDIGQQYLYSDSIGSGPLGLAENTAHEVSWHSLEDLSGFSIRIVSGYVNTAEFDQMVADGALKAFPVVADKQNIRKVAYGRIDLAVIDQYVLDYMLMTDPELMPLKDKVRINNHLLENKQLFVCFKRTYPHLADVLNEGLQRIDVARIQQEYMSDMANGFR